MADEPSNGELGRLIQSLREDWREDLGQLNQRLDKVVPVELYTSERDRLIERVTALEGQRERDVDRVTATRRWVIGTAVTVAVSLLPYLATIVRGATA